MLDFSDRTRTGISQVDKPLRPTDTFYGGEKRFTFSDGLKSIGFFQFARRNSTLSLAWHRYCARMDLSPNCVYMVKTDRRLAGRHPTAWCKHNAIILFLFSIEIFAVAKQTARRSWPKGSTLISTDPSTQGFESKDSKRRRYSTLVRYVVGFVLCCMRGLSIFPTKSLCIKQQLCAYVRTYSTSEIAGVRVPLYVLLLLLLLLLLCVCSSIQYGLG